MAAFRVVLGDGKQKAVRSYEVDGGELKTVDPDGAVDTFRLVDIDVERTFAANAGVDFARVGEPLAAGVASLQLVANRTRLAGDFRIVEGSVRNISPVDLEHVVVRATVVDTDGVALYTEDALIDRARLHAGLEATFRVVMRGTAATPVRLSFHQLLGDELLAVEPSNPFESRV